MTNAEAAEILKINPTAFPDADAQFVWDQALETAIKVLNEPKEYYVVAKYPPTYSSDYQVIGIYTDKEKALLTQKRLREDLLRHSTPRKPRYVLLTFPQNKAKGEAL